MKSFSTGREADEIRTLQELLILRRAGLFHAIWCDGWQIRIQYRPFSRRVRISWEQARTILDGAPAGKAAGSESREIVNLLRSAA